LQVLQLELRPALPGLPPIWLAKLQRMPRGLLEDPSQTSPDRRASPLVLRLRTQETALQMSAKWPETQRVQLVAHEM
jgi:hypothetical protein